MHSGDVYAVFSYEAQNSDELSFHVNEPLIVLRKGDDAENEWWWARNAAGDEGYVPRNLLGVSNINIYPSAWQAANQLCLSAFPCSYIHVCRRSRRTLAISS